ncbi:MAG: phosphoenolpyruvate--protein phosphotransferase [Candidatus Omnitrophica bacterium]|nr:phosphoenolpyruvate--protein phosphotransferase [Candidatus Omnitrophota bacterium]
METLKGIPVSPGVAIGKALVFHGEDIVAPHEEITETDIPKEIARFEDALTKTRAELLKIRKQLSEDIGRDHSDIFNAHLLILEDRALIEDVISRIKEDHINSEYAFSVVIQKYLYAFSQIDDEYLRERISDIKDIGRRLLKNLMGRDTETLTDLKEKVIIIAHDLSPSDTASMDKARVIAFATDIGGPTSHTAIMARSLEIPAVVGLERVSEVVANGIHIIIDGNRGLVIIEPDEETIDRYEAKEKRFAGYIHELEKLRDLEAETQDHHKVELAANIEFPDEIPSVIAHGAKGIGLYRSEYFYLNRDDLPTEEEQFTAYKRVAEEIAPHHVIVRTLDLGGDKFLSSLDVPYEMNPFLGWRAIRFCLARTDIFKTQLRAILRASHYGNIKIMYPMISTLGELEETERILNSVMKDLKKDGIPFNEELEVGAMIEIPSAAIISDILAEKVDFFSIGTNDLIQYTLAVDRVNEKIAYLYEPTHPAILKLIKLVIENAHAAGIWAGTCGEMGSDPALAVLLIGLGVDEISTSPLALPQVKKAIRSVSITQAREIAARALKFKTGKEIKEYADNCLGEIAPDLVEEL